MEGSLTLYSKSYFLVVDKNKRSRCGSQRYLVFVDDRGGSEVYRNVADVAGRMFWKPSHMVADVFGEYLLGILVLD